MPAASRPSPSNKTEAAAKLHARTVPSTVAVACRGARQELGRRAATHSPLARRLVQLPEETASARGRDTPLDAGDCHTQVGMVQSGRNTVWCRVVSLLSNKFIAWAKSKVRVVLRPTASWPVCLGVDRPSRAKDHISVAVRQLHVY